MAVKVLQALPGVHVAKQQVMHLCARTKEYEYLCSHILILARIFCTESLSVCQSVCLHACASKKVGRSVGRWGGGVGGCVHFLVCPNRSSKISAEGSFIAPKRL